MPYYGSSSIIPHGVTVVERVLPALHAPIGSDSGFSLLATCPPAKRWKIQSIWLHNTDPTLKMRVNLQLVPSGWIGSVSADLLIVLRELIVEPHDHVTIDSVLGMSAGTSLWGYQLEDTGGPNLGVTMLVAGEETG